MSQKTEAAGVLEHSATALQNADVSFSYPDPATVKGRVLADLLAGKILTHLDVWLAHGSSRAPHHVYALRSLGWPVISEEREVKTSDGRLTRITFYSLPGRCIARAGETGRRYAEDAGGAR